MQVERQQAKPSFALASGERVSNAYATYPQVGDSPGKLGLIPHVIIRRHLLMIKVEALEDGRACY